MNREEDERRVEELAKDNASELIVKKYAMKLRVRTVVLFAAILCVIFAILGAYVGVGWQDVFNTYESDVAIANGRALVISLSDEIDNINVKHFYLLASIK